MRAFIFDTETTGLIVNSLVAKNHRPRIAEFFGHVVDSETGAVSAEIEFLCDPGVPITEEITKITGIKPEDVVGKGSFGDHIREIEAALAGSDAVVAHNLSFDLAVTTDEFRRFGAEPVWPERKICTVEATEWMKGFRLSLTKLHEELFGEGFPSAHRARHDVAALTRCFLELARRGDV